MFASDTPTSSSCSGACAKAWPPLATSGAPTAATGATASLLGTIKRADGTTQVVYDGHPLYYFIADKAAGDTKGQGSNGFGAKWWVLTASGTPITAAAKGSTSAAAGSSASAAGGGGGWS